MRKKHGSDGKWSKTNYLGMLTQFRFLMATLFCYFLHGALFLGMYYGSGWFALGVASWINDEELRGAC